METLIDNIHPNSLLLGVAVALVVKLVIDGIEFWRRRRSQKPRPPFYVADVIAVSPEQVAELLRGNGSLLTVDQARRLLAMLGESGDCGYHYLMRRLGVAQSGNPGKQFLVLIES